MTDLIAPPDDSLEAFHRTVLDGLPEAVIVSVPDGTITFVNRATSALLGYQPAEIVGRPITDLVPRDPGRRADPVKWLARWAAEPDVEQSRFLDLTARAKDGRELTVEVRVRDGDVAGGRRFFITVRDITARRQEQIALKDANLRAARILMVAPDAIVSVDADQKITLFNPAAELMFGYSAEDVVGKDLTVLIPSQHRASHPSHVEDFRRSRSASRMMKERSQLWGQRRNGEVFPMEATITKVEAGGALTYTAHLHDVTQRLADQAAVRESEGRVRAVFDYAHEAIALLEPTGAIVEINHAGEALAQAATTLAGAKLWEVQWLGASVDVGAEAREALRSAVVTAAGGRPQRLAVELNRDGQPTPIDIRLTPIPGEDGAVRYVLAEGRMDSRL